MAGCDESKYSEVFNEEMRQSTPILCISQGLGGRKLLMEEGCNFSRHAEGVV